jgi:hypothetical protein
MNLLTNSENIIGKKRKKITKNKSNKKIKDEELVVNYINAVKSYFDTIPSGKYIISITNTKIMCIPNLLRFENLQILWCNNNNIVRLPDLSMLKNLFELNCSNNKLTFLPALNENLQVLKCSNNKLTYIPDIHNVKRLYCHNNKLINLPNISNLELLIHFNNPINKIINDYDLNIIKLKVKILNNFRFTYYCLKFKKQFKNLIISYNTVDENDFQDILKDLLNMD